MDNIENNMNWRLVNPEATIQLDARAVNQHPTDLAEKRVVLYWNGKPNGDIFLNRIGELFMDKIGNIKVIKAWEAIPSTKDTDPIHGGSRLTAGKLARLNPDIVIGAPGD